MNGRAHLLQQHVTAALTGSSSYRALAQQHWQLQLLQQQQPLWRMSLQTSTA